MIYSRNTDLPIAYFTMDENNPVVIEHCRKGCTAAILENGFITVKKRRLEDPYCASKSYPYNL